MGFNDCVLLAPDINQHLFVVGVWTALVAFLYSRTCDISSFA